MITCYESYYFITILILLTFIVINFYSDYLIEPNPEHFCL